MTGQRGARDGRLAIFAVLLACCSVLIGCSGSRTEQPALQSVLTPDSAPGVLLIDVLESGQPEHYRQYIVQPTIGLVRRIKEVGFPSSAQEDIPRVFQQPAGAIEGCARKPEASSLDGRYLAYCANSGSDEFFVIEKSTTQPLHHWKLGEWRRIRGFAWAPNSHSVSFLNVSSRSGKGPGDWISAIAGHPVFYDTIFLNIVDVRTGKMTVYEVSRDVRSSFTRILNWSE